MKKMEMMKKMGGPPPAASSNAQGENKGIKEKRPAADPNEVEIRLSDGSRVRMLILQGSLEIETKYGKLVTPTSELRRLEFGIRIPVEVTKSRTTSSAWAMILIKNGKKP